MMTQQASQYMQAESYEESMESMLQLEENTYDTQKHQPTCRPPMRKMRKLNIQIDAADRPLFYMKR